jgi:hypothetical protein
MRASLSAHAQNREGTNQEYGDVDAVRRTFNIRETQSYQLLNAGLIRGVLLRNKGSTRGRRLFSFESIRQYLASQEATGDAAPKSTAGQHAVAARMEKAARLAAYREGEE